MMTLKRLLRAAFLQVEILFDNIFGPRLNPLHQLGALGFFYYWVAAVSGIYVYIVFDTGTTEAYASVEALTQQWYLGGIMRSLHRYASDGMVLMMVVHLVREFALDRLRGPRWFTWVTGLPIFWLVLACGITGYWLVWDMLAQYVAIATTEWFDWLPIFGEPLARNFLSPQSLDDRLFTLLIFIHIAVPLILLLVLWIHLHRISRPRIHPSRNLAIGTGVMLLALALIVPVESQGPANLARVPAVVDLDWFYLAGYPLIDIFCKGQVWGFAIALSIAFIALPWLPPYRKPPIAVVDLDNCNGCARCSDDCPYGAVAMMPRRDGKPFEHEAVVSPSLCVGCAICAGSCPTSTPFRRASALVPGIDVPSRSVRALREETERVGQSLQGDGRVLVFTCDSGVKARHIADEKTGVVHLPCIGSLPPSFVDFVLSRNLADGIVLTGCRDGDCRQRFGIDWTRDRVARVRDPRLRARVPDESLELVFDADGSPAALTGAIARLRERLNATPRDAARSAASD